MLAQRPGKPAPSLAERGGPLRHRSVAQLVALSDAALERVDIVEMNIAVAGEIPGLEKLDYDHYRQIVDGWTEEFRRWLPTVEHAFHERPDHYHNDINFFRLGMLAQFLDEQVGIAYVEQQKQAQLEERKAGKPAVVFYTDPGHLLLHGLIDTKRGTCATMPALHVAIGRRLGWPVGLACVKSHYVCRFDDGQVVYNIEATDTGQGGFASGSDADYVRTQKLSRRAVSSGSDLRKLSAREMLGVFVAGRARHYADTNRPSLAAQDYALAHALFPRSRKVYTGLAGTLVETGERLFAPNEHGHPASLGAYLAARYGRPALGRGPILPPTRRRRDGLTELERINALNRELRSRLTAPAPPPAPPAPTPIPPHPRRPGR